MALGLGLGATRLPIMNSGALGSTDDFIMTVRTTTPSESFTIPTTGGGYNYDVDWGDGNTSTGQTGNASNTYAVAGDYEVKISGTFPRIFFNKTGDKDKVIEVKNLGKVGWTSFEEAFSECTNMTSFNSGNCDTSNVTSLKTAFFGCSSLTNVNLGSFNTSSVTDLDNLFFNCTSLPSINLSTFDTSSVTTMSSLFRQCISLTYADLSGWDLSLVTTVLNFFRNCNLLATTNLDGWNTGNISTFESMFQGANLFNYDISGWDISGATNINNFLNNCDAFDYSLASWDITSVTSASNFMILADGLSTANYDATLIGWEATLQAAYPAGAGYGATINIDFGGSTYTLGGAAETARTSLINTFGWTITDGGGV